MFTKTTSMFYNKAKKYIVHNNSRIDFTGEVNTEGDIHIDGNMKGTIKGTR